MCIRDRDSIQVLGVDGSDDALESIKNGEMTMTSLQDAKAQAEAGAQIFEDLKNGKDPADIEDVSIPFKICLLYTSITSFVVVVGVSAVNGLVMAGATYYGYRVWAKGKERVTEQEHNDQKSHS